MPVSRMQMRQIADKHGSPVARRHNIAVIIGGGSKRNLTLRKHLRARRPMFHYDVIHRAGREILHRKPRSFMNVTARMYAWLPRPVIMPRLLKPFAEINTRDGMDSRERERLACHAANYR